MSDNEKADASTMPQRSSVVAPTPANPSTLGLLSFASTTLILSLYNVNARGIIAPNVVVGMAIFCGGLAQLLAGMWEFPRGNMFGATAFSLFGAFWMSYATILIPGSGISAAYDGKEQEFHDALGIFLIAWFIVVFVLFVATLRKSIAYIALFGALLLTFILLAVANFVGKMVLLHAGGAFGIISAMIAYYIGLSELLSGEKYRIVSLPLGVFQYD